MNKIKSIILTSALLCTVSSTTNANLTDILSKYCVPTSGNCAVKATYNEATSKCECAACNTYYDKESRTCKVCPLGSYVNTKGATECIQPSCEVGYYPDVDTSDPSCGAGYYQEVLSSCN